MRRRSLRTDTQRETQPSQFKRPENLHEDRRVPDVHIVSCGLRLPVPVCRKSTASWMPTSMAVESPSFRTETPEKRSGFVSICDIANLTSSLMRCGEQAYPSETVTFPLQRLVLGNNGGHQGHRAAGSRRLRQRGCTTKSIACIQTRSWCTLSSSGSSARPNAG